MSMKQGAKVQTTETSTSSQQEYSEREKSMEIAKPQKVIAYRYEHEQGVKAKREEWL